MSVCECVGVCRPSSALPAERIPPNPSSYLGIRVSLFAVPTNVPSCSPVTRGLFVLAAVHLTTNWPAHTNCARSRYRLQPVRAIRVIWVTHNQTHTHANARSHTPNKCASEPCTSKHIHTHGLLISVLARSVWANTTRHEAHRHTVENKFPYSILR